MNRSSNVVRDLKNLLIIFIILIRSLIITRRSGRVILIKTKRIY